MSELKPWKDGCRVVDVGTHYKQELEAVPIHIAEHMKDYEAPMSESASRANEIIRNLMSDVRRADKEEG